MACVVLPELGEGIEKATLACWHVHVGDRVSVDHDIVEFVTDKASFNVSAGSNGIVQEMFFKEGQEVEIGKTLATIQTG